MKPMYKLGVDFGGTSIKCGVVAGGEILLKKSVSTPLCNPDMAAEVTAALCREIMSEMKIDFSDISSIGVGLPGTVNKGIVTYANNIGWYNVPFADKLKKALCFEYIYSLNDASCALLAEICFGAGKNLKNILMCTLGTGIGTSISVNGKLFEGNGNAGGEGGLMTFKDAVWEDYASTSALVKRTNDFLSANQCGKLARYVNGGKVDGKTLFAAELNGIGEASLLIDEHIEYVVQGLVSLVNLLRPELIIMGGAISGEARLISSLETLVNERAYGGKYNPYVKIKNAILGNDAGIIGAACIQSDN